MAQMSTFHILSGSVDKDALWLETIEGLANATRRMNEIAAESPGKYFVFCDFSHTVLALTDTATELPFDEVGLLPDIADKNASKGGAHGR